jgi:hypothetical protein
MKKSTTEKVERQPREPRSQRRVKRGLPGEVLPIRQMIREALMTEISAAASKTAVQLVEDEVERLLGKKWSCNRSQGPQCFDYA